MRRYRQSEIEHLGKTQDAVQKLLKTGVTPADATLDPVQLAAMTMVTAGVMNSPDAYSIR